MQNNEAGLQKRKRFKRTISDASWTKVQDNVTASEDTLDPTEVVKDASPPTIPTVSANILPSDSTIDEND